MEHDTPVADATDPTRDALADELLAVRCQLGEPAAFDALVGRWHAPLWRYVRRLATDDDAAADTLQDVWLRVLRALPALREPARLRPWLFGIAHRAVMDRLRRRYAEPEPAPPALADTVADEGRDDADDALVRAEELALLHEALARLPFDERELLALFYLRELSLAQLADALAVPVGTVKSRLHRARRLLRRQLTDMGARR